MDLPSVEKNLGNLPMTLTLYTPHHHPISINLMDSSRPWWRKSRMLTRKQTDPLMLRLEHYSSYVTHPSWQTSHPQQRFYMVILLKEQSFQDHQKESIYIRSDSDSLNFKKNRKKTMTKPTEPKIYAFSKSRNKSSSFTTNKAQAPLSGHLAQWPKYWNVDDPTWSRAPTAVYRRNSSFEAHMSRRHLLSRPSAQQGQICVFPEGNQLYGHQIHVVWWTRHTSNTPIITPKVLLT